MDNHEPRWRPSRPRHSTRVTTLALCAILVSAVSSAQSMETSNGCQSTADDPCLRTGSCTVQGSTWDQEVAVDRQDIFDTMGWAGVCDQVHVGIVQGRCQTLPSGDVLVPLTATSSALVSNLVGSLACQDAVAVPLLGPRWLLTLLGGAVAGGAVLLWRRAGR